MGERVLEDGRLENNMGVAYEPNRGIKNPSVKLNTSFSRSTQEGLVLSLYLGEGLQEFIHFPGVTGLPIWAELQRPELSNPQRPQALWLSREVSGHRPNH